jgi:hypothetical protein
MYRATSRILRGISTHFYNIIWFTFHVIYSLTDLITELGIPRTKLITTREPLIYRMRNEKTTAYVYKGLIV